MDLQIALDRISLDRALELTSALAPYADWVEAGTSMIKRYGASGLSAIVDAARPTPVLADLKTVDDVEFEMGLAFDCGARSATVLGLAPRPSVDAAVRFAGEHGRELVVDLLGLDTSGVGELVGQVPDTVVLAPHVGKDSQATGTRVTDLLGPWAEGRRIALAGGLTEADLLGLRDVPQLRVIVGSAVTKADDPLAAVQALRRAARKQDTDGESNGGAKG